MWNVVLPIGAAVTLFLLLYFGLRLWNLATSVATALPG